MSVLKNRSIVQNAYVVRDLDVAVNSSVLEPRVEALEQRQLPGAGEFPLREIVRNLPEGVTIGVEVPLRDLAEQGVSAQERARQAVAATRGILRTSAGS